MISNVGVGHTIVPSILVCKGNGENSKQIATKASDEPNSLEISLHSLPKPLHREFHHVFNETYNDPKFHQGDHGEGVELLAIPTNQRARKDLVAVGDDVEAEKDRLLNVFMDFAADVCEKIRSRGFWADYIDPCSGLPMLTPNLNTKVYSEVDGMEVLLGYRAYSAGFCKILVHPQWGSAVYPATIFCYAPRELTSKLLKSYPVTAQE